MAQELDAVAAEVKRNDPDRFLSALFAPEVLRASLIAIYAFNQDLAKVAESVREPMMAEIRYAWWSEAIEAIYAESGRVPGPARAIGEVIRRHALPRTLFDELIEARRVHDVGEAPIESWAAFESYADRTAGAVIKLASRVLGIEGDAAAGSAGRAWALTGHLRSLPLNLARHKLFVPAEMFAAHQLTTEDIFHAKDVAVWRPAISDGVALARVYLTRFRTQWRTLPRAAFPAFGYLTLCDLYLREIARAPADGALSEIGAHRRIPRLVVAAMLGRI